MDFEKTYTPIDFNTKTEIEHLNGLIHKLNSGFDLQSCVKRKEAFTKVLKILKQEH